MIWELQTDIWKLQTHMKIANSYENCKLPRRNYRPKRENCKLIWKLQTDMKIANWHENCKAILTFWCTVPTYTAEMKTCSGTEEMFRFDCGLDDKNSTKHSFTKPSTFHISIPIPMLTKSDSYFKPWFLCSLCHGLFPVYGIGRSGITKPNMGGVKHWTVTIYCYK